MTNLLYICEAEFTPPLKVCGFPSDKIEENGMGVKTREA